MSANEIGQRHDGLRGSSGTHTTGGAVVLSLDPAVGACVAVDVAVVGLNGVDVVLVLVVVGSVDVVVVVVVVVAVVCVEEAVVVVVAGVVPLIGVHTHDEQPYTSVVVTATASLLHRHGRYAAQHVHTGHHDDE